MLSIGIKKEGKEEGEEKLQRGVEGEIALQALGSPLRRDLVRRLRKGGAMSLSKLVEPHRMTLPAAHRHLRMLEESGIVHTHKNGRVRICVLNPNAFKDLAGWLASQSGFWEASFTRLERHLSKKRITSIKRK
ncbi:transcriptional regulator [Candidatus Kaiserbacteria bacterium CG10_big_fil_rev_8_21_14_0_10_51_14]|uniref:Transcriptional regulator n=1 Tax=Candidatus Kaiserbacteria bacterium CG10_big_fil_rev_8_21_14_0_10_51_14 TaxID=1974610 RepID=A0A2H0UCG9_9BACT|nr:MAG: transcriptional regulator [Candidatus Kaiserbacteria bacterium CG10_big_fil_rev_8_21_14_0_10_51_14]